MALQAEIVNEMHVRFLKEFMDILIMTTMRKKEITGYDMLTYFHKKFDLLVSPGTVYSMLYSMERNGLIEARSEDRRRIYSLTPKGEATIKAIHESSEALEKYYANLLRGQTR